MWMRRERDLALGIFSWLIIVVFLLFFFGPVLWLISTAFKERGELFLIPPHWIPHNPTIANFRDVVYDPAIIKFFFNSFVVAIGCVLLTLSVTVFAGYAFSRFPFRGSSALMFLILLSQMFPTVLLVIGLYVIFRKTNLLNSYFGLILSHSTITIPFSVWIVKSFYDTVPKELEEAACIDGCGKFTTLYRVILPLVLPGLVATAIYSFLLSWNDFIFGLTLVTKKSMRILGPGISMTYLEEWKVYWEEMMALGLIVSAPLTVIFIFLQRLFIRGLTTGAIKG